MSFSKAGITRKPTTQFVAISAGVALALGSLHGCGGNGDEAPPVVQQTLGCDDSLKTAFKPEDQTTVLLVERVMPNQSMPNPTQEVYVFPTAPTSYGAELCHVKLLVGPATPDAADDTSASKGIGIEVWLPTKTAWNGRYFGIGGAGIAAGTEETVLDKISSGTGAHDIYSAPHLAAMENVATATTDSGYLDRGSSFLMKPDGSINLQAWHDWSYRALREQAVKTKALIQAYYGSAPKYSYFDGASGGGRQAHHVAQNLPDQYNGIIAADSVINWMETFVSAYPELVIQRDLGGVAPTREQFSLVSTAAVSACDVVGGKHLGFILDERTCRYDPTRDQAVLCAAEGGTNTTTACLTGIQARAINKMWYGPTVDGTAPDPAIDNGYDTGLSATRRWYGFPRGTSLVTQYSPTGSGFGQDAIALVLGDPSVASTRFRNATGNGQDAWKNWSYAQFADAIDVAREKSTTWGTGANNPNLNAFKDSGGKFIWLTATNDAVLNSHGALDFYDRVISRFGNAASVQSFFRHYLKPGVGHGPFNGTALDSTFPPLPRRGQFRQSLIEWVEQGRAPENLVLSSSNYEPTPFAPAPGTPLQEISIPACAYPAVQAYVGGDSYLASSYTCR